jgi:5-methylcytosine-specific restriction endonuclease McrA
MKLVLFFVYESDKIRAYNRKKYAENPQAVLKRNKKWVDANPEKVSAVKLQHTHKRRVLMESGTVIPFTQDQWVQKCDYWGNKCYLQIPGICTGGADSMDHVKPVLAGSPPVHMLANMRPACRPCNSSKSNKWPYPVPAGPKAA